jgi:pentatricopeptide repeat protein
MTPQERPVSRRRQKRTTHHSNTERIDAIAKQLEQLDSQDDVATVLDEHLDFIDCKKLSTLVACFGSSKDRISGARRPWHMQQRSAQIAARVVEWAERASSGIDVNIFHFTSLMSVLGQAGFWQEALQLFESVEGRGMELTDVAYVTMIGACAKGGQWREAERLFERMGVLKMERNVRVYNMLITSCEKVRYSRTRCVVSYESLAKLIL